MKQSTPTTDTADIANFLKQLETQAGSFNTHSGRIRAIAALSGYKLSRPIALGEMARLLAGVKMPSPLQLAKLAAAVGPREKPDEAIRTALRFYLRATLFLKHHRNDSLADLTLAAADYDAFLGAYAVERTGEVLRLEMDKPNDPARGYLATRKCRWGRRARTLKDNLCAWCKHFDMLGFLAVAKKQPLAIKDSMTEKEKIEAIDRQARNAGWNKSDTDLLALFRENRPDN